MRLLLTNRNNVEVAVLIDDHGQEVAAIEAIPGLSLKISSSKFTGIDTSGFTRSVSFDHGNQKKAPSVTIRFGEVV